MVWQLAGECSPGHESQVFSPPRARLGPWRSPHASPEPLRPRLLRATGAAETPPVSPGVPPTRRLGAQAVRGCRGHRLQPSGAPVPVGGPSCLHGRSPHRPPAHGALSSASEPGTPLTQPRRAQQTAAERNETTLLLSQHRAGKAAFGGRAPGTGPDAPLPPLCAPASPLPGSPSPQTERRGSHRDRQRLRVFTGSIHTPPPDS